MHAEDGVDFMTIHCGINRAMYERFKNNKRLMNIVSRGGSIMFAWMAMTGEENPFYGRKHSMQSRELISKNHIDVSGKLNPRAIPVICVELDKRYDTIMELLLV